MNGAGWFLAGISAGIALSTLGVVVGSKVFGRRGSLGQTELGEGLWEVLVTGDGHIVDAGLITATPTRTRAVMRIGTGAR
jgi:hypothetical protein